MKKVYFFDVGNGCVAVSADKTSFMKMRDYTFLGEIEIQEPKKTVVKEADGILTKSTDECRLYYVPQNAKNIKCTYEVEE